MEPLVIDLDRNFILNTTGERGDVLRFKVTYRLEAISEISDDDKQYIPAAEKSLHRRYCRECCHYNVCSIRRKFNKLLKKEEALPSRFANLAALFCNEFVLSTR